MPILPFSLDNHIHVAENRVQFWISIALAAYGATLLIFSRTHTHTHPSIPLTPLSPTNTNKLTAIWGYLADRIQNRRIPMLIGLILLAGATVFLCLAKNVAMLLVGRALQGASSALTWTVGLALVVDTVGKDHVGRAMGWISLSLSLGILTSPLLGGIVYGRAGYYAVFAMCFGLLAVDIALRLVIIEVKDARRWLESDGPSQLEKTTPEPSRDKEDEEKGQQTALETQPTPIKPRQNPIRTVWELLKKPRLSAALWGTLVEAIIHSSLDSTLPLYVSEIFHWDSVGAGLIFLPLVLPTFASPLIGDFCDRYGPKLIATVGLFFSVPFFICLRFVTEDTIQHKVMLCGLLVGIGIGIACIVGPLMAEITYSLDDGKTDPAETAYAQAYGLYNMAFSGGTLVGPLLGGFIRDGAGWGTVGWSLAIILFFTAITQLIWLGGPLKLRLFSKR